MVVPGTPGLRAVTDLVTIHPILPPTVQLHPCILLASCSLLSEVNLASSIACNLTNAYLSIDLLKAFVVWRDADLESPMQCHTTPTYLLLEKVSHGSCLCRSHMPNTESCTHDSCLWNRASLGPTLYQLYRQLFHFFNFHFHAALSTGGACSNQKPFLSSRTFSEKDETVPFLGDSHCSNACSKENKTFY